MTDALTTTNTAITTDDGGRVSPMDSYLSGLSASSRRVQRQALETIAAIVAGRDDLLGDRSKAAKGERAELAAGLRWGDLRYVHTTAIRAALAEKLEPATANRCLSALRGVLKAARRLGYMNADDLANATDWKPVEATEPDQAEKGRHLSDGEIMAMVAGCQDGTAAGVRDAAILGVAFAAGLRRGEIANLELGDYNRETGELTVRRSKRNKTRIVPIGGNGAESAMLDWLHVRGEDAGPLFLRIRRGDHMTDEGITPQAVYDIILRRADQANVGELASHDFRRTFAGNLLDAGVDIAIVAKLMGHSSTNTTAGYDRRGSRAKAAAVRKLHYPYKRQFSD